MTCPRAHKEKSEGADILWSVQEVLGFDLDVLGIRARRSRRREHSQQTQLQPRLGVTHTSRLRPAVPYSTTAANLA